jgi:hypothetical protein
MSTPAADSTVERYLERVRAHLRGMPATEVREVVLELRGHIAERSVVEGNVESVLRSLGSPGDLARQYRADSVMTRAECGGSPLVILHSLLLLRRERVGGWTALVLTTLGYAWALVLGGAAIEKIISPHDVGLWYRPGSASLPRITVDGPGPPGTHELLGWWFVPVGLAASAALLYITRAFALWWIRRSHDGARTSGTS